MAANGESAEPEWSRLGTGDLLKLLLHLDEMCYPPTKRGLYYACKANPELESPSRATVTRVFEELLERGYVEEDDNKRVLLTDEGRELAENYPLDSSA